MNINLGGRMIYQNSNHYLQIVLNFQKMDVSKYLCENLVIKLPYEISQKEIRISSSFR